MKFSSPDSPAPAGGRPPGWRRWDGWLPLGVVVCLVVLIFGGVALWNREPPPEPQAPRSNRPPRSLPVPVNVTVKEVELPPIVARDEFDGVKVLKIRAQPAGDEILIEAATGKLMAVRDAHGKLTRWSHMPEVPMTATEPIKGS